jgi:hypothetical protein
VFLHSRVLQARLLGISVLWPVHRSARYAQPVWERAIEPTGARDTEPKRRAGSNLLLSCYGRRATICFPLDGFLASLLPSST